MIKEIKMKIKKPNCRKCIYLVRESKNFDEINCSKYKGLIHIPCFCAKYKTQEDVIKEQLNKEK